MEAAHESLPTRERELKRKRVRVAIGIAESLPTRERELKHDSGKVYLAYTDVAPHAGA